MQYGLIFCLYVSTWCIELLRCQALHIVISKLPLKYETWFPSRSMTAQAINGWFSGISKRGGCAVVEASALGSHLSTREMRWVAARPGKQFCFGLHLPHPAWCRMPLVIPGPAGHPWGIGPLQETHCMKLKTQFWAFISFLWSKMIQVGMNSHVLGTWVAILLCTGI